MELVFRVQALIQKARLELVFMARILKIALMC